MKTLQNIIRIVFGVALTVGLFLPSTPVVAAQQVDITFHRIHESPVDVTFRATIQNTEDRAKNNYNMELVLLDLSKPQRDMEGIEVERVTRTTVVDNVPVYGEPITTDNQTETPIDYYLDVPRVVESNEDFANWKLKGSSGKLMVKTSLPASTDNATGMGNGVTVF